MFNKKAQTTLEYAVLVAVIVGALVAMQVYMKRAAEGRLRSSTDSIGEQFDPLKTTGQWDYTSKSKNLEQNLQGGITRRITQGDAVENFNAKTGQEIVKAWDEADRP